MDFDGDRPHFGCHPSEDTDAEAREARSAKPIRPNGPGKNEFNIKDLMDDPNWATRIVIEPKGWVQVGEECLHPRLHERDSLSP